MVKQKPDEIEEQLNKQEDEVYGTGYVDGDPDKFDDTEDMVEDVTGNAPSGNYDGEEEDEEDEGGFSIADEVEKDEKAVQDGRPAFEEKGASDN